MVKRGKVANSSIRIRFSSLWKKHALGGGHLLASLASQSKTSPKYSILVKTSTKVFSSILVFSLFFISSSFIFSSFIIPITIPNTYATESTDKNTSISTTDKGYSLSIAVPKTVTIDLTPTPSGSFSYSELNTNVTTTNPTGYTLSFNSTTIDPTNPGTTTNPNYTNTLINTNTNITTNNTIPSITNDTNQSSFPTNSWGYSTVDNSTTNVTDTIVESLTFKPIPLPSSSTQDKQLKVTNLADNSTTPTTNTNIKLILGIKADNSLASGTYRGQLTFTVTPNYVPDTLYRISTMQEMTSAICSEATTPLPSSTVSATSWTTDNTKVPEVTLRDTRDGNTYVVRKLADGNCWMVQNLRLGGSSAITLTSVNSDVSSNFTLAASSNSFGTTNDAAGINIVRMHDNGNAYINDNYTNATQIVSTTGTPTSQTNYLGNYYNWYTATAGTGTYEMTSGNAASSICPKGWRLPKGTGNNGDFLILYMIYNLANNIQGSIKLRKTPLGGVLSGAQNGATIYNQGSDGNLWTSTVNSSGYVNYWYFGLSYIGSPDYYGNVKRYGLSVRCVAR